jgi:hypothetical protein
VNRFLRQGSNYWARRQVRGQGPRILTQSLAWGLIHIEIVSFPDRINQTDPHHPQGQMSLMVAANCQHASSLFCLFPPTNNPSREPSRYRHNPTPAHRIGCIYTYDWGITIHCSQTVVMHQNPGCIETEDIDPHHFYH